MGTRAVYTFKDAHDSFHVYKHFDNDPAGACDFIHKAKKLAWPLPRFEADEFAASFIAANKDDAGGVRLTKSPTHHFDLGYVYEISFNGKHKDLWVTAYEAVYYPLENVKKRLIFRGTFDNFRKWVERRELAA
jgi:hypothetical protein